MVNRTIHLGDSWAGGAFDPSGDTNKLFWYKTDDTTDGPRDSGGNVPSDGENVAVWQDSSGNAFDLDQLPSVTSFVYNTNSLNGMPGVTPTSAAERGLRSGSPISSLNSNIFSLFVLARNITGAEASGCLVALEGSGTSSPFDNAKSFGMGQEGSTTEEFYVFGNGAHIGDSGPTAGFLFSAPKVLGIVFDGVNATRYLNGAQVGTPTAWASNLGNTGLTFLTLGATSGLSTFNAQVIFYEVYGSVSAINASSFQTYITNKWGSL
jgi:hypothetical protein